MVDLVARLFRLLLSGLVVVKRQLPYQDLFGSTFTFIKSTYLGWVKEPVVHSTLLPVFLYRAKVLCSRVKGQTCLLLLCGVFILIISLCTQNWS